MQILVLLYSALNKIQSLAAARTLCLHALLLLVILVIPEVDCTTLCELRFVLKGEESLSGGECRCSSRG